MIRQIDIDQAEAEFPFSIRDWDSYTDGWVLYVMPTTGFAVKHLIAVKGERVLSWDHTMKLWCTVWSTSTWIGTDKPGHKAFIQHASHKWFTENSRSFPSVTPERGQGG